MPFLDPLFEDRREAGRRLTAALHRTAALFPFDSKERRKWHCVPKERRGAALKAMNEAQRQAAMSTCSPALRGPCTPRRLRPRHGRPCAGAGGGSGADQALAPGVVRDAGIRCFGVYG